MTRESILNKVVLAPLFSVFFLSVWLIWRAIPCWAEQPPLIPGCACKQVDVVCSDEQKNSFCGVQPSACVAGCKVYLRAKTCSDFGLTTGTWEMGAYQESIKRCKGLIQSRPSFDDNPDELMRLLNQCTEVIHELFHLCVPTFTSGGKQLACEEWGGKNTEAVVYSTTINFFCSDEKKRIVDGKLSPTCRNLCAKAYEQHLMSGWLKCLCDAIDTRQRFPTGEDWLTKQECCSCRDRCLQRQLDGGEKFFPEYCLRDIDPKELKKGFGPICDQLTFDPQHYSCGKMSRDGQKQFGQSCP